MNIKSIPNYITIFRIILIIPIIATLLTKSYEVCFYLFIVAGLSDSLDGFLARRFSCMTQLGAFLDPLADKALLMLTYLSLGYLGHLPDWLVAIVIGRDVIILGGVAVYRKLIEEPVYSATFISKLNTVAQILLVTLVLFNQVYLVISARVIEICSYIVASLTVSSLLDYVWMWGRRAFLIKRGKL